MVKFYEFRQNNSGGYFIKNKDVRESIFIEECSEELAVSKMEIITKDYSEYCSCCGERWGNEACEIYDDLDSIINKKASLFREGCIVYFLDGTKENIHFKKR